MTYRVVILPRARADIDRNAEWWAQHHSVAQALHWMNTIYDQIDMLDQFPEANPLCLENDSFDFEIREKSVGLGSHRRYRAVFTIQGGTVTVLTVRAAEQDRLTTDDVDLDTSWD